MGDPPPSPTFPESRTIDFDLPCLECDYNLRGLSGDPIRCPECGFRNPVVHGRVSHVFYMKEVLKAHHLIPQGAWGCLVALLGACLLVAEVFFSKWASRGPALSLLLAFIGLLILADSGRHFRQACATRDGWLRAYLLSTSLVPVRYAMHFTLAVAILAALGAVFGAWVRAGLPLWIRVAAPVPVVILWMIDGRVSRWVDGQVRGHVWPLVREEAARRAYDRMRREMSHPRR